MNLIIRLAQHGLIHCDFNEFNLMIDDEENITLIDFPQMVSTTHENAEFYFDRDVQCVRTYFERRYNFIADFYPKFSDYNSRVYNLDIEVEASGYNKQIEQSLESFINRDEIETGENHEDDGDFVDLGDLSDEDLSDEERSEEEDEEAREEAIEKMKKNILDQQRAENSPKKSDLISLKNEGGEKEDLDFLLDNPDDLNPSDDIVKNSTEHDEVEDVNGGDDTEEKPKKKLKKRNATTPANSEIRQKVKKNLARRNKPKLKPNSNKNRTKRNAKAIMKDDFNW